MLQKTYSRLTARLKASKIKRKAFQAVAKVEENVDAEVAADQSSNH
jgi:hypothetical protein